MDSSNFPIQPHGFRVLVADLSVSQLQRSSGPIATARTALLREAHRLRAENEMPQETKFTLALLLVLCAAFGVVVWQKMEHQKKLLAAMKDQSGSSSEPAPNPFEQQPPGPTAARPGAPAASPFDQASGSTTALKPVSKPVAPIPGAPSPFDVNKPVPNPFDAGGNSVGNKPSPPPRELFSEPKVAEKPAPAPGGFNPFESAPVPGNNGAPRPTAPAPVAPPPNFDVSAAPQPTAPRPTAPKPPAPAPGDSPFDAFPATHTKVVEAPKPDRGAAPAPSNLFDSPAPAPAPTTASRGEAPVPTTASRGAAPAPAPTTASRGAAPAPSGFARSPFDEAPLQPAPRPDNSGRGAAPAPADGGFNPFTPVQHTEEKPTPAPPPKTAFNPFDEAPLPPAKPPRNEPLPSGPSSVPSPFDHAPLPTQVVKPAPKPIEPAPKPIDPAPKPVNPAPKPTYTENGFPSNDRFTPPPGLDNQPARVYTVQADETYWSISKKLYGTVRYFQALAEHNRHRVGDPKHLRPGMKILVPEAELMEQLYAKILPGGPKPGLGTEPPPEGLYFTTNGQPMYRVGQEDTLGSIALKHLGRTTRWVEIYNMNQDVLKTPDRLRIGIVLKMPADASRIVYENDARAIR